MRRASKLAVQGMVFAAIYGAAHPGTALANGRFPLANQLVVDPSRPSHMVARATFGILETDDAGATWTWICEDAVGYFGVEDPSITVTADGSTVVASSKGLSVSHDGGCSWTQPAGMGPGRAAVDVTVNPMNPHEVLALTSAFANGIYSVALMRTDDDGGTWIEVGPLPSGVLAETLEIAPSRPDRVYVSARLNTTSQPSVLLRSDDGGQTWTQSTIDLPNGASSFIGAIDPRNPDVVYLRASVPTNTIGRVLVTKDAGATWTVIWRGAGAVDGFALSGDGANLAVGGPESGVDLAATSDFVFTTANTLGPSCLTWSQGRLLACGKEAVDLFSIGVSDDKGINFTPLLHFADITPRTCGASTSASVCSSSWGAVATTIGIDAGVPDVDIMPLPPTEAPSPKVDAQGGWKCTMGSPGPSGQEWIGVLGAALACLSVRLRRRSCNL